MTQAEIQPYLDADPFEPFTITMTHGGTYEVTRREEANLTPDVLRLSDSDGRWRGTLSIDHITSIASQAPPTIIGGKA